MLVRLRQGVLVAVAACAGYAIGSGPFAEWTDDFANMLRIAWLGERVSRGPSGAFPLLMAGFLLGQGLYLLGRQILKRIEPMRARRLERLGSWEPAVNLGTRFGLHQYLAQCAKWAMPDPSARVPTLALFKIRGLGVMNEKYGSIRTTRLLQRVAAELRSAAVPDSASPVRRWIAQYLPPQSIPKPSGIPIARYPARWSGATFALAFRELDPVLAATICRDVADWIRNELGSLDSEDECSLTVAVVVGAAGVYGRDLTTAAAKHLSKTEAKHVVVQVDSADMRAEAIAQLNGVQVEKVTFRRADIEACADHRSESPWEGGARWFRSWGASLGCVAGAVILLGATGGKQPQMTSFPWPETLHEIQVVEQAGSRVVQLQRTTFAPRSVSEWAIFDCLLIQASSADEQFHPVQFRVSVRNTSSHSFFVGANDFTMIDGAGRRLSFDELRSLRMASGFWGFWIHPGETRTGWLVGNRQDRRIVSVEFAPNRTTRIALDDSRVTQSP